jgi:hypothetical protein
MGGGIGLAYERTHIKRCFSRGGWIKRTASLGRVEWHGERSTDPTSFDAAIPEIFYFDVDYCLIFAAGGWSLNYAPTMRYLCGHH